jgi:hypothetical protein
MYKLLLIIHLLFSWQAYCQSSQPGNRQLPWRSDTLSTRMASQLAVKKEIADSLLSLIYASRTAISSVLQNRSLTSDDKNACVKTIADARNAAIEKLLRPEQIEKLKAIMAVEKEKWRQKQ